MMIIGRVKDEKKAKAKSTSMPREIHIATDINYHYAEIMADALKDKMGAVNFNNIYYPVVVSNDYILNHWGDA